MHFIARILAVPALIGVAAAPVAAQSDPADNIDPPEVVGKLFECRAIENPEERLACFDREVGAVYDAQETREIVIADREEVQKTKRGLFGFKLPKIRLFGGGDGDEDEVKELTATLADARRMNNGRFIFELEDGARWMQTETPRGFKEYEAGDTIVIKKASLGSFMAKVNGDRAVRVRRLN